VIDDDAAEKTGTWSSSASVGGFVGSQYLHDNNQQKGELAITYRFAVKEPGTYEVYVAYTPNANRATNVPVTIQHAGGAEEKMLNERQRVGDRSFVPLGKYRFDREAVITITNKNTDGYVVVDAVQLRPAP
jgi:hypothetical protein